MMEGDGEGSGCGAEYSFLLSSICLLAECEYFSHQLAMFLAVLYNDEFFISFQFAMFLC